MCECVYERACACVCMYVWMDACMYMCVQARPFLGIGVTEGPYQ